MAATFPGTVLKVGTTNAADVKQVAKRLADLGYKSTSPAGNYDAAFKSLIMLYQSQHVDALHRSLKVDGEIGPVTWGSIFDIKPAMAAPAAAGGALATKALAKAISQIGVREHPLGSNKGAEVEAYLGSTGLGGGYYWCMAFVYWCFREAAAGGTNPFPKTAGCLDAWNKAKPFRITKSQAIANPSLVLPGSVFILDYGNGNGHTGFVKSSTGGALVTVEGNTNNDGSNNGIGVFELSSRNIMAKNLKGFIIIP